MLTPEEIKRRLSERRRAWPADGQSGKHHAPRGGKLRRLACAETDHSSSSTFPLLLETSASAPIASSIVFLYYFFFFFFSEVTISEIPFRPAHLEREALRPCEWLLAGGGTLTQRRAAGAAGKKASGASLGLQTRSGVKEL